MFILKPKRRHLLNGPRRYIIVTSAAPSLAAAIAASIAVFPAPITATLPATVVIAPLLYPAIKSSAFVTPGISSPAIPSR